MVDLFSLFFRFVGKYFEVKDVLKGVFRSHNVEDILCRKPSSTT